MNVLCGTDGSDEGYETVKVLAGLFGRGLISKIKIIVVTFPAHESPLWEKASELWLEAGDLHRAMAEEAEAHVERLKSILEPHADAIESEIITGDPVQEVLQSADSLRADLVLLGITSDHRWQSVQRSCWEIVSKSTAPVVIAYGRAQYHPSDSQKVIDRQSTANPNKI